MISNYHHSRNNLVKSNSYHGNNGQYHRKSLVDNTATQQGNMMLPPMNRISRASTMSTIMEKQHPSRTITPPPPQNIRNKKRHSSSSSNRISAMNLMEDDIPLALLAYKKGYTSMSPQLSNSSTSDRPPSSSMIQRNHSQSSDASLVKKKKHQRVSSSSSPPPPPSSSSPAQPAHKRKKKPLPYQLKTNTDSSTSQSSTVVATPTIEQQDPHLTKQKTKMSFNKKWLSSLRKLLSTSSKK